MATQKLRIADNRDDPSLELHKTTRLVVSFVGRDRFGTHDCLDTIRED
jgi:hypothetical protein